MEGATEKIWKRTGIQFPWDLTGGQKNGTIQRIFEELQKQNIIDVQSKVLCLDTTSIKVHPDATGAKKSSGKQSIVKKLEI